MLPSVLRVELPTKASITVVSLISAARQLPCVSIRTPDPMVALFLDLSKMTFADELTTMNRTCQVVRKRWENGFLATPAVARSAPVL